MEKIVTKISSLEEVRGECFYNNLVKCLPLFPFEAVLPMLEGTVSETFVSLLKVTVSSLTSFESKVPHEKTSKAFRSSEESKSGVLEIPELRLAFCYFLYLQKKKNQTFSFHVNLTKRQGRKRQNDLVEANEEEDRNKEEEAEEEYEEEEEEDPAFATWKQAETKKLRDAMVQTLGALEEHDRGECSFDEMAEEMNRLASELFIFLKAGNGGRRSLSRLRKLYPGTYEEINGGLEDLRSSWRQYYTYLNDRLKRKPKLLDLVELENVDGFVKFYAKNDHPTESQGHSSSAIYNRCTYLSRVLLFFRLHPSLFSQDVQEKIVESYAHLNAETKIYRPKKVQEATERKSGPIRRIESKDFGREERKWIVVWLALEVDNLAESIEKGRLPLGVSQCLAFQHWSAFLVFSFSFSSKTKSSSCF